MIDYKSNKLSLVSACFIFIILCVYFYYLPIIFLGIMTIIFFSNEKVRIIGVALLFAILGYLFDLNGSFSGDVEAYYYLYNHGGVEGALLSFKIGRAFIFNLMNILNSNVNAYAFFNILIIFLCYGFYFNKIIDSYHCVINRWNQKVIYFIVFISFIPASIYSTFENLSAFSCVLVSFIYIREGDKYRSLLFFVFAILIHQSVILIMLVYILFKLYGKFYKNRHMYIALCTLCFVISYFILKNNYISTGVYFVDYQFVKISDYFNGPWSRYSSSEMLYLISSVIVLLVIYWITLNRNLYRFDYDFIVLLLVFLLFCFIDRTLLTRFSVFCGVILSPFVYVFIMKLKVSMGSKLLLMFFVIISLFSMNNIRSIYSYSALGARWGNNNIFIMNFSDIYKFKVDEPEILKRESNREL